MFPLRIKVLSGYYGFPYSISNEEVIDIKRKIEMEVIIAVTNHLQQFSIPVNLKYLVSVVHNYHNDMQKAIAGYEYKSVADLMLANPCPKVVCARNGYGNLLEQNEELIVKELTVVNDETMLNVYSMKHKITKLLPKHCIGEFSTCPMLHKLHVSDIVKHKLFPCTVISSTEDGERSVITLTGMVTQVVLICTNPIGSHGGTEGEEFELPINLPDVTVTVLEQSTTSKVSNEIPTCALLSH